MLPAPDMQLSASQTNKIYITGVCGVVAAVCNMVIYYTITQILCAQRIIQ